MESILEYTPYVSRSLLALITSVDPAAIGIACRNYLCPRPSASTQRLLLYLPRFYRGRCVLLPLFSRKDQISRLLLKLGHCHSSMLLALNPSTMSKVVGSESFWLCQTWKSLGGDTYRPVKASLVGGYL